MSAPIRDAGGDGSLAAYLRASTHESVTRCYQCGKCTAGCPLAEEMDFPPSYLLRMLQAESPSLDDQVLRSLSIWLCLTCEMCLARCPQEVDLPRIMDALRQESNRRSAIHPGARDILTFYRSFLDSVRWIGRLHEVGLVTLYKLRTGHLLQDVTAVPGMMIRGKLKTLPPRHAGRAAMDRIFSRAASVAEPGVPGGTAAAHEEAPR